MGQRWTDEEIAHAVTLKYEEFTARYPGRTYAAWASARHFAKKAAEAASAEDAAGGGGDPLDRLSPTTRAFYTQQMQPRFARDEYNFPYERLEQAGRSGADGLQRLLQDLASGMSITRPAGAAATASAAAAAAAAAAARAPGAKPSPVLAEDRPLVNYLGYEMPEAATDDDLLDALITWQDVRNRAFATRLDHHVTLPVRDGKPIALCFPSDWHIGNVGTDHRRIIEDNKLIMRHPRLYCALGGDPVDNFVIEKMISASRSQVAQVDVQWRLFRHLVGQLVESNSLLFVGAGNHDAWTQKVAGLDGISAALRGLPVVNTGEGGFITLTVGDVDYGIYRKHKPTRFNSKQNPTHFLKQMLRMGTPWDFDIGISEHFHDCNIEQGEYRPGTGRHRVFVTTGSYKVRDDYSESLGYYGGGYGVPCVVLFPDRREMLPVMKIEQAIRIVDAY